MINFPQSTIDFMIELTEKSPLPMEMWMVIFEKKDKFEYIDWVEKMKYVFSEEYSGANPKLRTKLRSGRQLQGGGGGGARVYNIASQCIHSNGYKNDNYFKIKGLFDLVTKYYIWIYKREMWSCENHCSSHECAPWCQFSQERQNSMAWWETNWQQFFYVIDVKIVNMVSSIMRDYDEFKKTEPIKKILHKKDPHYNWDTWFPDQVQSDIAHYLELRSCIKKTYNTIPMFLKCVGFAKKLDYFKNLYFQHWKYRMMTQEDFQFELSIYKPTKWKKYLSQCRKLRSGKLIGPKLHGMKFYDDC